MKLGNDPQSRLVLTAVERAVLRAAGRSLGVSAGAYEAQVEQARVVSRTYSGVGFVTRLGVPAELASVPPAEARRIGPVLARHPQLGEPAEFVVQVKDGRLASIEAFCYAGMWPEDEAGFSVMT